MNDAYTGIDPEINPQSVCSGSGTNCNFLTGTEAFGVPIPGTFTFAIWGLLNPAGSTPANPLIDDAGANADAVALIAVADADWRYDHTFVAGQLINNFGSWVNQR
ncbi:MAG: hypothetical protein OEO23_14175 [Gemmatimonadota bacterium]|nr:hypothetical protein [Gemmatimonadota bacterium]